MNIEYKDNLKKCCLHRWDGFFDKFDLATKVVNAELGSRSFSSELNNLTVEEEFELVRDLILYLLSNR